MCTTCGCGTDEVKLEGGSAGHRHVHGDEHVHADGTRHSHEHGHDPAHEHSHEAGEGHGHSHAPGISATRRVQIEQDILSKNNAYAAANRDERRFGDDAELFDVTRSPRQHRRNRPRNRW